MFLRQMKKDIDEGHIVRLQYAILATTVDVWKDGETETYIKTIQWPNGRSRRFPHTWETLQTSIAGTSYDTPHWSILR